MDINKRTILWIVFAVSLVILWNDWMVSIGKQSMFSSAPPAKVATMPAATGSAASSVAGVPTAALAPGVAGVPGAPDALAAAKREVVTITTDVLKVDIDTAGGVVRRLELLKFKQAGHPGWFGGCFGLFEACKSNADAHKNEVLFGEGPNHAYLAQSGLIGGAALPNHNTVFVAKPGARAIDGGNDVQLVLESEQGGVKLTKTYTFHRGSYVIDVRHDVSNLGATPVTPSLYLQLLHDGNKPEGDSFFNSSFTGPTLYTPEEKYQKPDFATIEKKGHADHPAKSSNGWIAISQHFFVSAFVPQADTPREIYTKKVDTNRYAIGTVMPLGAVAPGATVSNTAKLYSGPQDEKLLETVAPGLDLVKDYGFLTIIAKPIFWVINQIHSVLGNWGWTIIVFTILIKLAFFPLSAAGYKSMAKVKMVTPKMQAIRERYKGDPAKMNQATMELYKTEKI
ncbi:MAG: membrane protein insertase YidC, partial [Massilia sp.]|nr:membrane protein insertase YidC [Massilia sp.]